MLQEIFQSRISPVRVVLRLFIGILIGVCPPFVQGMPQAAETEARLRERIAGFWDAMQKPDFETATLYIHPSSRNLFRHQVPKARVLKWRIEKLTFNKDYTLCDTVVRVTRPFPMMAESIDWPLRNQWVLHEGEWYFKLAWEEGENPLVKLFKEQESVKALAPGQGSSPNPIKGEPPKVAEKSPRITGDVSNPHTVRFGEKTTFRFQYTNNTQVPFKISSAHSDCHCTAIKQEFPEVAPGQSGVLEVTLDTFGLPLGRLNKVISIQFSDLSASVTLTLSVENAPNFKVLPPAIDFGTVKAGTPGEKTAKVVNRSGRTVAIIGAYKADPRLEFSFAKSRFGPGEEIEISLRYNPAGPGEILDNFQLRTDLEAEPIVTIPIRGRIAP